MNCSIETFTREADGTSCTLQIDFSKAGDLSPAELSTLVKPYCIGPWDEVEFDQNLPLIATALQRVADATSRFANGCNHLQVNRSR